MTETEMQETVTKLSFEAIFSPWGFISPEALGVTRGALNIDGLHALLSAWQKSGQVPDDRQALLTECLEWLTMRSAVAKALA